MLMVLTCGVCVATREPGIVTRGQICQDLQLHSQRERTIAHVVGGRNFHKVNLTRLQFLQQGHGDGSCW